MEPMWPNDKSMVSSSSALQRNLRIKTLVSERSVRPWARLNHGRSKNCNKSIVIMGHAGEFNFKLLLRQNNLLPDSTSQWLSSGILVVDHNSMNLSIMLGQANKLHKLSCELLLLFMWFSPTV